jgi:hypothetical protein
VISIEKYLLLTAIVGNSHAAAEIKLCGEVYEVYRPAENEML